MGGERGIEGGGCGVVMDRNFGTKLGDNYVCVQTLLITFAILLCNKTKLLLPESLKAT